MRWQTNGILRVQSDNQTSHIAAGRLSCAISSLAPSDSDTVLSVHLNTETVTKAPIKWHISPLDGCFFACKKFWILSARPPPFGF